MKLHCFTFNPLGENTYLAWCEESLDCVIIDAGMYNSSEQNQLQMFISDNQLNPVALLGTHAHIDHIFGNWWVKQIYQIPYYLHQDDVKMIDRSETMAALWNLAYTPSPQPDHFLNGGDTITVGKDSFQVRFVPGHAPGHVIFVNHAAQFAVVGDTVFQGSIGRTDLPGGNHQQLIENIEREIFTLPDNYTLFSGHGNPTTVGIEKNTNPFFN